LNPLELKFKVTPDERQKIDTGDTVWFKPGTEWDFKSARSSSDSHTARITSISYETDENGLYPVRARAENSQHRLTPGKTVSVRLPLERIERAVKIPLTFVDRKSSQPRAVLIEPDRSTIHKRDLTIIDYRDDSLIAKLDWPANWKLIPGGVYTDSSGSKE
jgi:multidrug efflux pump subunit AcrA (membrane-fusion protein)